jgi:hypothetical protein
MKPGNKCIQTFSLIYEPVSKEFYTYFQEDEFLSAEFVLYDFSPLGNVPAGQYTFPFKVKLP